jgi:hypothetical protein
MKSSDLKKARAAARPATRVTRKVGKLRAVPPSLGPATQRAPSATVREEVQRTPPRPVVGSTPIPQPKGEFDPNSEIGRVAIFLNQKRRKRRQALLEE